MKYIDIEKWNRKEHFNFFSKMDYPQFNICSNLDITNIYKYIKENELPFFITILYSVTKAANNVNEFKLRIRDDKVVEHESVSPSFTVLSEDDTFSFCTSNYIDNYLEFKNQTINEIEKTKNNVNLEDEAGRDDYLFISSIPWVSFTSITHPINLKPVESIPRITWGKFFESDCRYMLPISVQVHHGLVDGIHLGKFFKILEEIFNNPKNNLK